MAAFTTRWSLPPSEATVRLGLVKIEDIHDVDLGVNEREKEAWDLLPFERKDLRSAANLPRLLLHAAPPVEF